MYIQVKNRAIKFSPSEDSASRIWRKRAWIVAVYPVQSYARSAQHGEGLLSFSIPIVVARPIQRIAPPAEDAPPQCQGSGAPFRDY